MPSPSPEISSFRPRRSLFGYERKATDDFLEHVAELVEHAQKRLEQLETELAEHREKDRSLNEALLSVAKVADTIKYDARLEEEAIRAQARKMEQIVGTTRSQLTAFLRETLEKLEKLSDEIDTASQPEHFEYDKPLDASNLAAELTSSAVRAKGDGVELTEESSSTLGRLGPDTSASAHSPEH